MIGTSSRNEMAPTEFYDFAPAFSPLFFFFLCVSDETFFFFPVIKVKSEREATENIVKMRDRVQE